MTVKAWGARAADQPVVAMDIERRAPGPRDVQIEIAYCGICHSDLHTVRSEWGGTKYPCVPGHEIVGHVSAVGGEVKDFKVGDTVGVGCLVGSCKHCKSCDEGLEQYCENGFVGTYNGPTADAPGHTLGGYSQRIVVDRDFVLKIRHPEAQLAAVAPLLCAGITTYSPLRHWNAGPGKKVAILGLGGLGHMGVKIAHAMGAEVTVLSQTLSKQADGLAMGADHYYATSDAQTFKTLAGTLDLIICTVSAGIDWGAYLNLLKIDGTMVLVGAPEEPVSLNAFALIPGRRTLAGSMIGSIKETQEMLDFCGQHDIVADIETISIDQINEAYKRMAKSDVRYRFVIDMATL